MKIFKVSQANRIIKARVFVVVNPDGKSHMAVEVPDGQGIKFGCDNIKNVFGAQHMDHSDSSDYKKEMKSQEQPVVEEQIDESQELLL